MLLLSIVSFSQKLNSQPLIMPWFQVPPCNTEFLFFAPDIQNHNHATLIFFQCNHCVRDSILHSFLQYKKVKSIPLWDSVITYNYSFFPLQFKNIVPQRMLPYIEHRQQEQLKLKKDRFNTPYLISFFSFLTGERTRIGTTFYRLQWCHGNCKVHMLPWIFSSTLYNK